MRPRPITADDLDYWGGQNPYVRTFRTDAEVAAGVEPCDGIVTETVDVFGPVVRVPWKLDEIEVAHLAHGGTLWLSTWGGLPMHMLEVQERPRS